MKTSSNRIDLGEACNRFETLVHRELQRRMLTGVSVAWVDDQQIVYLKGFGLADPKRNVAARPDTVYRAGSISKLFTAVAAMQLAEQGKLDIDRPVTDYAPQFRIVVPFDDCRADHAAAADGPSGGHDPRVARGRIFRSQRAELGRHGRQHRRLRVGASARHGDEVFQHRRLGERLAGRENHRHAVSGISAAARFRARWA